MDCTVEQYSPELPESIIHRVQSLLNSKKAAQTTLLSKPWLQAWSTRPDVELEEADFETGITLYYHPDPRIIEKNPYPTLNEFAKKTLRMYKQSKLGIQTFKLSLKIREEHSCYLHSGQASEWTLKALKLGATDLTFQINHPDMAILLNQVSGRENVSSLRLQSSKIDQLNVFKCPGLKSLALSKSRISRESLFNIISCSPLIENLSIQSVHENINHQSHRYRGYDSYDETSSDYDYEEQQQEHGGEEQQQEHGDEEQQQQHVVRSAPPAIFLHNLRSLALCRVSFKFEIKALFLDDLSSKFPNLKHLTLKLSSSNLSNFWKQGEMHTISSGSLEVLSFGVSVDHRNGYNEKLEMVRFEFDLPCIRELTLDCKSYMPNMFFTSASMDRCESHVSLTQHGMLSIQWFHKLSKLLAGLNGSRINLFLRVDNRKSFHYRCGQVTCMSVCELENLTMNTEGFPSMSFINLVDGLFRICRPKMITQYIGDKDDDKEMSDDDYDDMSIDDPENTENNDEILFHELQEAMKYKSILIPSRQMYGLRDLEELHVEKLFDGVWMRSQPLDSILDDSHKKFRLQLKWKPGGT